MDKNGVFDQNRQPGYFRNDQKATRNQKEEIYLPEAPLYPPEVDIRTDISGECP